MPYSLSWKALGGLQGLGRSLSGLFLGALGGASSPNPQTLPHAPPPNLEYEVIVEADEPDFTLREGFLLPGTRPTVSVDRGTQAVAQLRPGDRVQLKNGHIAKVTKVAMVTMGKTMGTQPLVPTNRAAGVHGDNLEGVPSERPSRVVGWSRIVTRESVFVSTKEGTVETTPEHPFYVMHRGWVPAEALMRGDVVGALHPNGVAEVTALRRERGAPHPVFNLVVEGTHTYRVGSEGLWVHNGHACGSDLATPESAPPVTSRSVAASAPRPIPWESRRSRTVTVRREEEHPEVLKKWDEMIRDNGGAISLMTADQAKTMNDLNNAATRRNTELRSPPSGPSATPVQHRVVGFPNAPTPSAQLQGTGTGKPSRPLRQSALTQQLQNPPREPIPEGFAGSEFESGSYRSSVLGSSAGSSYRSEHGAPASRHSSAAPIPSSEKPAALSDAAIRAYREYGDPKVVPPPPLPLRGDLPKPPSPPIPTSIPLRTPPEQSYRQKAADALAAIKPKPQPAPPRPAP